MNILLITPKETKNSYEQVVKQSSNANLIGTITIINQQLVSDVSEHYHPHIIVWVSGAKNLSGISELEMIKKIKNEYQYIRFIYFDNNDDNITNDLMNIGIFDIVERAITNIEFNSLLNVPLTTADETKQFNKGSVKTKEKKDKRESKINWSMLLPVIILICLLIAIIILLLLRPSTNDNDTEIESSTETSEAITELKTDTPTTATLVAIATQLPTQEPTQKPTEKTTQKPTEKATQQATTNSNTSSNIEIQTEAPTIAQYPPIQQSQQQCSPIQNEEQPQEIVTAQAQEITDDGQIHFDRENYNVKVGDTFDVYVNGFIAKGGCNWDLTNGSVAKFVSSETNKVTIKALNKGKTTLTATAKLNGTTTQTLITVE